MTTENEDCSTENHSKSERSPKTERNDYLNSNNPNSTTDKRCFFFRIREANEIEVRLFSISSSQVSGQGLIVPSLYWINDLWLFTDYGIL